MSALVGDYDCGWAHPLVDLRLGIAVAGAVLDEGWTIELEEFIEQAIC
jgi:hypothetical protein